ncbi:PP2C family protein-serine/threonine phosphatase [Leptospira sp. 96542]|nr:PP2C family protein-serine/threonine phosphatase [Leptospira sp. 96542]
MKIETATNNQFQLDDEVLKISRICLAVFFTFISFGILAPVEELGFYDPKWIRILHSALTLFFFVGSYFSKLVRIYIQPIMIVFFYTMSAHSLILLYWNSLYVGYLIGMILVISCIGTSFFDRKWLVSYLSFVTSAGILIGIYTEKPLVDLPLYLSSIITPALVSYLTLNIRLSSVEKLRDSETQLKRFHDRISYDLEMAKETQTNLIANDWPKLKNTNIYTFFRSFDEVGGDSVSYIQRSDGRVSIFFADVSGHGIASAMVSAMAILAFKIHATINEKPSACLRSIHDDLQNLVPNNHISAAVIFLDVENRSIEYSIAGHPQFLFQSKDGDVKFLEGNGTLIVSYLPPMLGDYQYQLEAGDRILLYSDGMIEIFDENEDMYGEEHLVKTVKIHSDKKGNEFLNVIYEDVLAFSAKKISDDMSMLLIEIT